MTAVGLGGPPGGSGGGWMASGVGRAAHGVIGLVKLHRLSISKMLHGLSKSKKT